MNATVLDFHPLEPLARDLMERALEPHILLGMPHLTPFGLSETWLMKELGHRHWLMLARQLGMNNADFRTADGEEAYAAICATSLSNARFETVRANDILTIRSLLTPVSRTQVSTRHRLAVRGMTIGEVELISTFVCRMREGDNYSIARVAMPQLKETTPCEVNALATLASAVRSNKAAVCLGLSTDELKTRRSYRFEPDQTQEFNGAGLFYFAQFQAVADRASEKWFSRLQGLLALRERRVFFRGNVRAGETLSVDLVGVSDDHLRLHCVIRRSDGTVIGNVFTRYGS
ncbi:Pnap_2097 family protein [Rhizobium sp. RCC_161_2]|uniref:Pnap_2097 family protein n=1 Tax=Rhizobium sp. RCC_161_2 TaxID=3239219 RepID=UPI003524C6EC